MLVDIHKNFQSRKVQKEEFRKKRTQDWRDSGLERFRTVGIQDWRDSGLERFRTGGIRDWRDPGKEGSGYRRDPRDAVQKRGWK